MFPPVVSDVQPESLAAATTAVIAPNGFREYDARWLYPQELNLMGVQRIGLGLAELLIQRHGKAELVVGHDYRAYSPAIKFALISGLMAGGARVHDIGLAVSPMAYFAQFALGVKGVAMVTASHNENGWTGIKMGANPPLTFGPEDMQALKTLVLSDASAHAPQANTSKTGGQYRYIADMRARYLADLTKTPLPKGTKIKAIVACGNGTPGIFAPQALRAVGVEVVPLHCELDYNFPHHNPNPEDVAMLHAVRDAVRDAKADIGFAFDGDGDRIGVVDETGEEIFADKLGVILARWLAPKHKGARLIADVKSTNLFATDPVLQAHNITTEFWKTGHSYMKRHTMEQNALAGFEKSGHFFLRPPLGRGYDDGILSALLVCRMLAETRQSMHGLLAALPPCWSSPTCAPHCPDDKKYALVERLAKQFAQYHKTNTPFCGQTITDVLSVNGVRVQLADGGWVLIRASSNKPSLVVVTESPQSHQAMYDLFCAVEDLLKPLPDIGAFDQRPAPS